MEHVKFIKNLKFATNTKIREEIRKASPGHTILSNFPWKNIFFYGLGLAAIWYFFFRESDVSAVTGGNDGLLSNVLGQGEADIKPEENIETRFSDVLVRIRISYLVILLAKY
jgi:hypothetical protein